MKITRVLWDGCPNGIDLERVYDTDGDVVGISFKHHRVLSAQQARDQFGVDIADDEAFLLYPRSAIRPDGESLGFSSIADDVEEVGGP